MRLAYGINYFNNVVLKKYNSIAVTPTESAITEMNHKTSFSIK
jgi:hypothetical protein